MNTIFALSSAPGKAGVAVFRISGNKAVTALKNLGIKKRLKPRHATLVELKTVKGQVIDKGLAIYFPGPNSFTGEDVVELHVHGSRVVVKMLASELSSMNGIRQAEPGEFTRRALENGKMDLLETEGLADLINAETAMQHKQALRQMGGELSKTYEDWRQQIIKSLAHLEAYIDFPDEDLPEDVEAGILETVEALKSSIKSHLNDNRRGELLRSGLYATIIGSPNVGKSSLLNYLAKRDVAIVSHIAGTTRDVIEVHLDIAGYPITIADTAGLRETEDIIESEGVRRAKDRAGASDMKIIMFDGLEIKNPDKSIIDLIDENSIILVNKIDVIPLSSSAEIKGKQAIPVSVKTGSGLKDFLRALEEKLTEKMSISYEPALTREHHRKNLEGCVKQLESYVGSRKSGAAIELCAEELRLASSYIGRITGRITLDEVLDTLFKSFCIGK